MLTAGASGFGLSLTVGRGHAPYIVAALIHRLHGGGKGLIACLNPIGIR